MQQDPNNPLHWTADDGKQFERTSDNQVFGNEIVLSEDDSIFNYAEVDDPAWSGTEAEMENVAMLKYVNEKTGKSYRTVGDALLDLVNNNN